MITQCVNGRQLNNDHDIRSHCLAYDQIYQSPGPELWRLGQVRENFSISSLSSVYLNLERRPDRRKRTEKELSFLPFPLTRINAIDGKKSPKFSPDELVIKYDTTANSRWDIRIPPLQMRIMSPGEIGCCLSHLKALRMANTIKEPLIVFEDDVVVYDQKELLKLVEVIPNDADLFYLGNIDVGGINHQSKNSNNIAPITFCFGMYAYIILNAPKILSLLPISAPIDVWYGTLIESGKLIAYAASPPVCNQIGYGCNSDIVHTGAGDGPRKC